jgi:hypothetical protein
MLIYVVYDYDKEDGIEHVNSLYDEETFKREYKHFVNEKHTDWCWWYYVIKMELNKDSDHSDYEIVYLEDYEKN